jgi:7-cyano-7-deazaguanine synthase
MVTSAQKSEHADKLLILVSGGPDSATLSRFAKSQNPNACISTLYLRSGHSSDEREIECASVVSSSIGARLEIADISDLVRTLGNARPLIHSEASIMPFGNGMVLSMAIAYSFRINASTILLGLHKDDASENVEYTRGFIDGVEKLAAFGHSPSPRIGTPFLDMSKYEVMKLGSELGVDFARTWSCIRGALKHCGQCGACRARRRAFDLINLTDPTLYEREPVALDSVIGR